jgi:hypothetical protein
VTNDHGTENDMTVDAETGKVNRSLVMFDLSSLPGGASIASATLTLCYSANPTGGSQGHVHEVRRVTSTWDELVTWGTQPSFAGTATDSIVVPTSQQCMTFDVTADVQLWVDGTTNDGWQIMDQNEGVGPSADAKYSTRENGTVAERPQLVVSYSP